MDKTAAEAGIQIPDILLPRNKDLKSWSVIACDQYTQDRAYWKKAEETAAGKPSTLDLILPEVYLSDSDKSSRIAEIKKNMSSYLAGGVFSDPIHAFIYTERTTSYGRTRHGLIAAVDLETYEWKPFSRAFIRATEATIVERIPPRKEIRSGAQLELPHIMLLVNDPAHELVEGTGTSVKKAGKKPVYDGDLMMNGGHIPGWAADSDDEISGIKKALAHIAETNTSSDGSTFLFAVGDGNHSLATAKAVWDEHKTTLSSEARNTSRVRYALVEIVNIYDSGLTFEPIHRVLFNAAAEDFIGTVKAQLGGTVHSCAGADELEQAVKRSASSFGFVYTEGGEAYYKLLETP